MSTVVQSRLTPEQYLASERASDQRHEFINGQIYAMTGATDAHNYIVGNLYVELRSRLRGRSCRIYAAEMRVKVPRTQMYTYPDVAALCEPRQMEDSRGDTLLNPSVVFEVLSPSTESYDRGEKFAHYRRLDSLREYVLVAQNRVRVERYVRGGDAWTLTEISDPDASLRLDSLDCEIPLRSIYENVEFDETLPAR